MSTLQGKVAIVTGGSRGIGRAIAERLGRDGATVVVNYAQSKAKADEVTAAIRAAGGRAMAIQGDVSKLADIRNLFETTVKEFGRVDILIANAGVLGFGPIAEVSEAEFDRVFATNTKGTFFSLQQAARHLADGGRVVVISSGGTKMAWPGASIYAGSKGAVEQFVKSLAFELAPRNISVNTVSPGFTETDMLNSTGEQGKQQGIAMSPFRRLGRPEEIASAVSYLVSGEAGWVTAQNIQVGGGVITT